MKNKKTFLVSVKIRKKKNNLFTNEFCREPRYKFEKRSKKKKKTRRTRTIINFN